MTPLVLMFILALDNCESLMYPARWYTATFGSQPVGNVPNSKLVVALLLIARLTP